MISIFIIPNIHLYVVHHPANGEDTLQRMDNRYSTAYNNMLLCRCIMFIHDGYAGPTHLNYQMCILSPTRVDLDSQESSRL